MHVCSTGMRFTATLDAINSGASTFWVGAMLASISLGPMCFAIPSGRWLDRGGPRGPLAGARIGMMLAGSSVLLFPAAQYGIASLFAAATLTGFSFMLTNVVVQRLTGDVSTPKTRQLAFTALSLTTATSNLASPLAAGSLIEHFSYAAVYMWALGLPLLLSIVLLFPGMRRLLNTASRRRKKFQEADGQTNKERSGSAMDFLKDPPMRAVLCASVMISIAWEVGNLLIPVYADSVGLSPSEIGWVLGRQFEHYIKSIDHWVAFVLLGFIGGKMMVESLKKEEDGVVKKEDVPLNIKEMFVLAVATSIDALAVGITFAFLGTPIVEAISIIGCTTFVISVGGVYIGNFFGSKYKNRAEFVGGLILVLLGLKILLEHLGILAL